MDTDVTVLSATAVTLAVRVESYRVDGTKMTLDTGKLLFEHQVEEARVELANPGRRRCHLHRLLTTAKYHLK